MLSPGAGLGAQASAVNKIKQLHDQVIDSINQFPSGSREQQALLRVAQTLSLFTKPQPGPAGGGPVPEAIQKMNAPGGMPPGGPPMPPMPGGPETMMGAPA